MRGILVAALFTQLGVLTVAPPVHALEVDTGDRPAVVAMYQSVYLASGGHPHGWTGDYSTCDAGSVLEDYQNAGLLRVNYFRAMAGLPAELTLNSSWNAKCQEAALIMTANRRLSHYPTSSWACYTTAGADAAGNSNLAGGYSSLSVAITKLMMDSGVPSVGHRRWFLYPPLDEIGVGSTFGNSYSAHAIWVIGGWGSRPSSPEWVAWPPEGYVPYDLASRYWSFSYPNASFSGATVTMLKDGVEIGATLRTIQSGYGDNTLVWTPADLPSGPPSQDTRYRVTLDGVTIGGQPRSFTYEVVLIDPTATVSIGPETGSEDRGALLFGGSPNPFRGSTTIRYRLSEPSRVTIRIFNLAGGVVTHFGDGLKPAGDHAVWWDGTDRAGQRVRSGVYFVEMATPNSRHLKKITVLK